MISQVFTSVGLFEVVQNNALIICNIWFVTNANNGRDISKLESKLTFNVNQYFSSVKYIQLTWCFKTTRNLVVAKFMPYISVYLEMV